MNSWDTPTTARGRTIRILARGSLVASGATVVRARLSVFGVIGKVARRVGRTVRLGVGAQQRGEGDEGNKAKATSRRVHEG